MTTHCDEQLLQGYIDGRLTGTDRLATKRHFVECRDCAARYRALMTVDSVLRRMPREQAGEGMTETVLARLAGHEHTSLVDQLLQPRVLMGLTFVLFGAAAAVGVLIAPAQAQGAVGTATGWGAFFEGPLRNIGGIAATCSGFLMKELPQLFSAGALPVTLPLVMLVPLFLAADRILAKRRVMG